ncbi:MAG: DegT/DnrJ/EryC1/StrS family aminotransferase [Bryobacteraceae bacterium]|nr:DegT/DnrJ/EryC1/StrS family aminotransferase [Bryobacteraceae bacterium]
MHIPDWPAAGDREFALLRDVLASTQWGGFHPLVHDFEQQFANYQHCEFGIAAMNGTVTLEAGFAVEGLGPGDEVIVPAISFVSTATALSRVGATPVFVDIEPYSFNVDPAGVEAAIGPRTKGIVAVHFGGPLAKLDDLQAIARRHGLPLYEDAAHAHGGEWQGRRAGSFGRWSSFSFQNGKVMTAGEGGALVTNDADVAQRLRNFINQGRRADGASYFHHYSVGTNFRLTAIQAAVLTAQLERLPGQILQRQRAERLLRELTEDLEWLRWQEVPPEVNVHPHYLLPGRIGAGKSRDAFHQHLQANGVPCTPFYPHPLYGNPLYQQPGTCRIMPCPNAEACVTDAFWLPHRLLLAGEDTLHETAEILRAA